MADNWPQLRCRLPCILRKSADDFRCNQGENVARDMLGAEQKPGSTLETARQAARASHQTRYIAADAVDSLHALSRCRRGARSCGAKGKSCSWAGARRACCRCSGLRASAPQQAECRQRGAPRTTARMDGRAGCCVLPKASSSLVAFHCKSDCGCRGGHGNDGWLRSPGNTDAGAEITHGASLFCYPGCKADAFI